MKLHRLMYVAIALVAVGTLIWLIAFARDSRRSNAATNVVIIKFVTHPALDELETGFVERIKESALSSPSMAQVQLEMYNANGSPQRAKELAEISTRPDVRLIVAIATPAAQAVARTPSDIPLLYGAVADPQGAHIIPSARATGIRNAGAPIIDRAVTFLPILRPNAKVIGTLYNPGEQNSVYVQSLIKKACEARGLRLVQRQITDSTQISAMTEDLCNEVDVIYSANDNTVNAGIASIAAVAKAKRIPFVIGDLSTLPKGATAAVGLEYKSMGRGLADIAEKIIRGTPLAEIPPSGPPSPETWIDETNATEIGLQLTDEARAYANKILGH